MKKKDPCFDIADELMNTNKYLSKALDQANEIIHILEEENLRLKDVLTNLASINNKDLTNESEVSDGGLCTI